MNEDERTFGGPLGGSSRKVREEKVLQYLIHRLKSGARLQDATQEEYVHRNLSPDELDEVIRDPELVHAARERLEAAFGSDELRPEPPASG